MCDAEDDDENGSGDGSDDGSDGIKDGLEALVVLDNEGHSLATTDSLSILSNDTLFTFSINSVVEVCGYEV